MWFGANFMSQMFILKSKQLIDSVSHWDKLSRAALCSLGCKEAPCLITGTPESNIYFTVTGLFFKVLQSL